jgi:hypothetical protein
MRHSIFLLFIFILNSHQLPELKWHHNGNRLQLNANGKTVCVKLYSLFLWSHSVLFVISIADDFSDELSSGAFGRIYKMLHQPTNKMEIIKSLPYKKEDKIKMADEEI